MRARHILFAGVALLCATSPAHGAPSAEKALAGTSWYELGVFEHLDKLTPEERAQKQACDTPKYTFEKRDKTLVVHSYLSPDGYDAVYAKSVATKDDKGTKYDLFKAEDADASAKPDASFILLKDGEAMMNPSTLFDNGLLKCHSVASPIPAPRPVYKNKDRR